MKTRIAEILMIGGLLWVVYEHVSLWMSAF